MAVKRKSDSESIEEGRQNKRVATEAERDAEGAQASGNGNNAENEEDEVEDASTNSSIGCSLVHARSITSGSCWVLQNRGGATGGLDIDTVFESATQQVEDECTKAEEKSSQVSISETEKERIISDLMRLASELAFQRGSISFFLFACLSLSLSFACVLFDGRLKLPTLRYRCLRNGRKLYFHQARRPNQPLSKTELLKVLEKYRGKGINDFALSQCKKRFLEIFGYKIVELTKFSRKMKTSRSAGDEPVFFLSFQPVFHRKSRRLKECHECK